MMASLRTGARCLRDLGAHTATATTRTSAPAWSLHLPIRPAVSRSAPRLYSPLQSRPFASTTTEGGGPSDLGGDAALDVSLLKAQAADASLGLTATEPPSGQQSVGRESNGSSAAQSPESRSGFDDQDDIDALVSTFHVRPVPVSPSYFARQTNFLDAYLHVQDLYRRYSRLPMVKPGEAAPVTWTSKDLYRVQTGEKVKASQFTHCMKLAKRLYQIHPDHKPEIVSEGLKRFQRAINSHAIRRKPILLDRYGRTHGVGRRKTSSARAWVVQGTGEVLINGVPVHDAFARIHDRESALWALKVTNRMDKYNVFARVDGGGTTGQAEALAMAIGKALTGHEPGLKTTMRKAGLLTRDSRAVERKKPGKLKARKSPAWVKR